MEELVPKIDFTKKWGSVDEDRLFILFYFIFWFWQSKSE